MKKVILIAVTAISVFAFTACNTPKPIAPKTQEEPVKIVRIENSEIVKNLPTPSATSQPQKATPQPTVDTTAKPTETPTATPSVSPSASPSVTPSASTELTESEEPIQNKIVMENSIAVANKVEFALMAVKERTPTELNAENTKYNFCVIELAVTNNTGKTIKESELGYSLKTVSGERCVPDKIENDWSDIPESIGNNNTGLAKLVFRVPSNGEGLVLSIKGDALKNDEVICYL